MNKMVSFHNHTSFSFSDAILNPSAYVEQAKMLGVKSIGVSEHNNLCSWLDFQAACKKADIKPICAVEWYFYWSDDPQNRRSNHLLTIAKTEEGYRNILKLMALSNTPMDKGGGFYYRPRINEKMLYEHKEGLLVGSACLSSPITSLLIKGDELNARIIADEFKTQFGENFFFEVFPHQLDIQAEANRKIEQIARELDIPVIISLDVHFQDASMEEVYLINGRNRRNLTQSKVNDPETDCLRSADFYFKDCDCIADALVDQGLDRKTILNAFDHSIELDKKINFEYKDYFHLPNAAEDPNKALLKLLNTKIVEKFGGKEKIPQIYKDRLRYEYNVVVEKDFSNYFLILEDAINFCKTNKIEIGVGRGSAGGCLMAYVLGITRYDPILYNLPFERFLNPFRESFPDVDTDLDSEGRKLLIEYLKQKWGEKNVVQIITFGEVKSKVAIKDVAKYLEIPFKEVNAITSKIPSMGYDDEGALVDIPLSQAIEIPEVQKYKKENEKLFNLALQLEGSYKTFGVHAGGVVILPKPANEIIPIMHKKSDDGADVPIIAWDKKQIEKIGLIKYDFLGLSTLVILRECRDLTGVDIDSIPLNDKKTWKYFQEAKHMKAVFQFTEPKTCKYLRDSKPANIEQLSAVNTGIRPGSDWDTYIKNKKKNVVKPKYDLPIVKEVLKDTFGAILYQDDLLFLINKLSELNLGEADLLRRAFEKNNKVEIEKYKERFISTCVYKDQAEELFNWLKESCGYLFAKAHSCLGKDSEIMLGNGSKKKITDVKRGDILLSVDEKTGDVIKNKCLGLLDQGIKKIYKIKTKKGKELICTGDHLIFTKDGYKRVDELFVGDTVKILNLNILDDEIVEITELGEEKTYDLSMEKEPHNFIANGIVVHNCAYSINGYLCSYFKANYPAEFLVANLRHPKSNNKQSESEYIADFIKEAREMGIQVLLPKLGACYADTTIVDGKVIYGLRGIKGIGNSSADSLAGISAENFDDFVSQALEIKRSYFTNGKKQERAVITKAHIRSLVKLGFFGDIKTHLEKYNGLFKDKEVLDESNSTFINDALGFQWQDPLNDYLCNLDDRFRDSAKYVIFQVKSIKNGTSKFGNPYWLVKANSNIGDITIFQDGLEKNKIYLASYTKSGDIIKLNKYKEL